MTICSVLLRQARRETGFAGLRFFYAVLLQAIVELPFLGPCFVSRCLGKRPLGPRSATSPDQPGAWGVREGSGWCLGRGQISEVLHRWHGFCFHSRVWNILLPGVATGDFNGKFLRLHAAFAYLYNTAFHCSLLPTSTTLLFRIASATLSPLKE